jgi:outer membrane lipoprotein SlyB
MTVQKESRVNMKSDNLLVRLIVNGLVGALVGAVLLGLLGLLLAGSQGFANGAVLGAVFGLIGGFTSMSLLENTAWFSGVISRYGKKRHVEEPEE